MVDGWCGGRRLVYFILGLPEAVCQSHRQDLSPGWDPPLTNDRSANVFSSFSVFVEGYEDSGSDFLQSAVAYSEGRALAEGVPRFESWGPVEKEQMQDLWGCWLMSQTTRTFCCDGGAASCYTSMDEELLRFSNALCFVTLSSGIPALMFDSGVDGTTLHLYMLTLLFASSADEVTFQSGATCFRARMAHNRTMLSILFFRAVNKSTIIVADVVSGMNCPFRYGSQDNVCEHPVATARFAYDNLGRSVSEEVEIASLHGLRQTDMLVVPAAGHACVDSLCRPVSPSALTLISHAPLLYMSNLREQESVSNVSASSPSGSEHGMPVMVVGVGAAAIVATIITAMLWQRRYIRGSAAAAGVWEVGAGYSAGKDESDGVSLAMSEVFSLGRQQHWLFEAPVVTFGEEIGRGPQFDVVYKAQVHGHTQVAAKLLRLTDAQPQPAADIQALYGIRHPNVMLLQGVCIESPHRLWLLLEWVEGPTLTQFVRDRDDLDRPKIAIDVARGLQFLHACRPPVSHGNLWTNNVIIATAADPPEAKIADVGLSAMVQWSAGRHAPLADPLAADILAFGRVLLFIFSGREEPDEDSRASFCHGQYTPYEEVVRLCLQPEPADRPNMSKVLATMIGVSDGSLEGQPSSGRRSRANMNFASSEFGTGITSFEMAAATNVQKRADEGGSSGVIRQSSPREAGALWQDGLLGETTGHFSDDSARFLREAAVGDDDGESRADETVSV